ncbi:MAG: AEC family transporter [Aquabacterium sp.]|nr:AEC family transporter [Aquabacterium sp.]
MSLIIFHKLLGIFCTVAVGWAAGRMRWLGEPAGGLDPARLLGNAAFYIFVPALLFRATARMDVATMPWSALGAYFVPAVAFVVAVYGWHRWRQPAQVPGTDLAASEQAAAQPATRAFAASFGNSAQVGVPVVAALFGEAGLGIHVALISLHALLLLTLCTMLVELDLARTRSLHEASASLWRTLRSTVRNAVVHPVTLPVLLGALWHATGLPLPTPLDETLVLLGSAVAPLCLVLIGITLAYTDTRTVRRAARAALGTTLLKLLVLPALVLAVAHWGLGLQGLALQVVVLMAALPTGSNVLIFAQRYHTLQAEATTAIMLSTLGYMATVTLWLAVLARLAA